MKKNKKLVPCNSSNCHSPCDCKNTGSDECDVRDRVVGAILPTLVAAQAVGAAAGDGSESDDDVPWSFERSTQSLARPNRQPSQGTGTERTKATRDLPPWLCIAGTRRQSLLVWTVKIFSRHSGEEPGWLAGWLDVLCCTVGMRTTTALTLFSRQSQQQLAKNIFTGHMRTSLVVYPQHHAGNSKERCDERDESLRGALQKPIKYNNQTNKTEQKSSLFFGHHRDCCCEAFKWKKNGRQTSSTKNKQWGIDFQRRRKMNYIENR